MAQLSRPYQIALVAMAVPVLVWFVALRGHSASSASASVASTPVQLRPRSSAASPAKAAAKARSITAPIPAWKV